MTNNRIKEADLEEAELESFKWLSIVTDDPEAERLRIWDRFCFKRGYLAACEKCEWEGDAEMVRLIDALRMAIAIIDESEPMNGHPDLDAYMYCKDELHNISEQFKTQSHDK